MPRSGINLEALMESEGVELPASIAAAKRIANPFSLVSPAFYMPGICPFSLVSPAFYMPGICRALVSPAFYMPAFYMPAFYMAPAFYIGSGLGCGEFIDPTGAKPASR